MKIDSARWDELHKNFGELADGLFSVVAQTRLIEMFAVDPSTDQASWCVQTSELNPEGDDGMCNSSFTAGNESLYEIFTYNTEYYEFKTRDEAMAFYFAYITKHNHF